MGYTVWDGRCVVGGDGGVCVRVCLNPDEVDFSPFILLFSS